jgi:septal ring factor EnvC (AmiA/AmiB activator)
MVGGWFLSLLLLICLRLALALAPCAVPQQPRVLFILLFQAQANRLNYSTPWLPNNKSQAEEERASLLVQKNAELETLRRELEDAHAASQRQSLKIQELERMIAQLHRQRRAEQEAREAAAGKGAAAGDLWEPATPERSRGECAG